MSLQHTAKYRVFFGPGCRLVESALQGWEKPLLTFPSELLSSIRSAEKRSDVEESTSAYHQYHTAIQKNNYENYHFCIMQLFLCFQMLWPKLNSYTMADLRINIDDVCSDMLRSEFSTQIDGIFCRLISQLCTSDINTYEKHSVLLESVKRHIDIHYADKNLSLKSVASKFRTSQSYLGRLFREYFNTSVSEYITQVRSLVATGFLTQSNRVFEKSWKPVV